MEKYFKMTKESLAALAGRVSGRLRTSGGVLEVVPKHRIHKRSTGIGGMLGDLVELRTVTGSYEENHEALEYIDRFLSEKAMRVMRFEWNGFESLVATTQHTKTPKVMLIAHVDVVPGEEHLFKMQEKGGKYFGRGVFDMKFAIAAYLQLVHELEDHLHEYDFGIMVTTDEEIGGFDGVKRLIDEEGYLPQVAIVPDGGDDWNIETFCKGIWLLTLRAKGKNAHGSRPWEGISANQKIIDALEQIKQFFPGKERMDSTMTITMMHGGQAVNQVAAEASASLDIRLGSVEDARNLQAKIRKFCKSEGLIITDDIYADPFINDPKNPYIASFMKSIAKVTGKKTGETTSFAHTDARHFGAKQIPCVIVRPTGGNLHGPQEWISKEGLSQVKDVIKDYVEREARLKGSKHKT